jgi:HAD superfamily hydrolase (TIGR01509 family)
LGSPPPADLGDKLKAATLARLRSDLSEVPGAGAFIRSLGDRPRAIASSSSADRLALCLEVLGFSAAFEGRVFSADMVARGKPEPDIYLLAARALAVDPRCCTVIEDSASGVIAGKAAGMRVIGLCAGSHVRPGHAERLQAAGADHVAESWEAVARLVS